jgi:hypothetical protein
MYNFVYHAITHFQYLLNSSLIFKTQKLSVKIRSPSLDAYIVFAAEDNV